ncbi:MAG: Ig-like domain-containing protein, partial [Gemmatimonadota bacterium]
MRSDRTGPVPEPCHRSTASSPAVGRRVARSAVITALVAAAAGCDGDSARNPLEPTPGGDVDATAAVVSCEADVAAGTLACAPAADEASDSAVEAASDAAAEPDATAPRPLAGDLILGGQGTYIELASSNVGHDAGTNIFSADVTVENLIGQALATEDGETGHADGVRVFFHTGPIVTSTDDGAGGTASVENADGTATFTNGDGQPYFQYGGALEGGGTGDELGDDGVLSPGETSDPRTWEWQLSSNVERFEFTVFAHGAIEFENGWLDVTPAVDTLAVGDPDDGSVTLSATALDHLGQPTTADEIEWSSSDEDVATVDASSGEVTAVAPGTPTITATDGTLSGTAEIVVPQDVLDDAYPQTVIGNMGVRSDRIPYAVTDNDATEDGASIDFAGWDGAADETEEGGVVTMTTSGEGMGEFDYEPPTGFEGTDRFVYVVGEDTATVTVDVDDVVWFIDNAPGACASDCDGRLSNPFTSLVDFEAANDGGSDAPADGHTVFLYESSTAYTGPVTLRDGQTLVGQDATATLE